MEYCAIMSCSENNEQSEGLTFYSFPVELDMEEKWINATGRDDDWEPTEESRVCSKHFTDEDFTVTESGHKFLKPDACPSVNITSDAASTLSDSSITSISSLSEGSIDINDNEIDDDNNIEDLPLQEIFPYSSTGHPGFHSKLFSRPNRNYGPQNRQQKVLVRIEENLIKRQKRQIAIIQGQNRRLRKKIKLIEDVIEEIRKYTSQ